MTTARHIPMAEWGKDHWSTFAYIETRIVDYKGEANREHMRCDPRLHPAQANSANRLSDARHPTRLKGAAVVEDHDDWSCLEDAEREGLLRIEGTSAYPVIRLTERGLGVAAQLRAYKINGGVFSTFEPQLTAS